MDRALATVNPPRFFVMFLTDAGSTVSLFATRAVMEALQRRYPCYVDLTPVDCTKPAVQCRTMRPSIGPIPLPPVSPSGQWERRVTIALADFAEHSRECWATREPSQWHTAP